MSSFTENLYLKRAIQKLQEENQQLLKLLNEVDINAGITQPTVPPPRPSPKPTGPSIPRPSPKPIGPSIPRPFPRVNPTRPFRPSPLGRFIERFLQL